MQMMFGAYRINVIVASVKYGDEAVKARKAKAELIPHGRAEEVLAIAAEGINGRVLNTGSRNYILTPDDMKSLKITSKTTDEDLRRFAVSSSKYRKILTEAPLASVIPSPGEEGKFVIRVGPQSDDEVRAALPSSKLEPLKLNKFV